jgi:hypothetical protein
MNIDRNASQVQLLIHAKADVRGPVVMAAQPAMNRDPSLQLSWVHHCPPDLLAGRGYLDRRGYDAHEVANRSLDAP